MGAVGLEPTGATKLASGWEITRVGLDYVPQAWPYVEPYVAKALEHTMQEYEAWDVYQLARRGVAQLWLVVDENKQMQGCIVTEIMAYPRRNVCTVWLAAGKELTKWDDSIEVIEAWATYQGCDLIRAIARRGWSRYAKARG